MHFAQIIFAFVLSASLGANASPAKAPTHKAPVAPHPFKSPPKATDAELCAHAESCTACYEVHGTTAGCGFTHTNPGKCVPRTRGVLLAITAAQCTMLQKQHDTTVCEKAKTCDACHVVTASSTGCGFTHADPGKCVPREAGLTLAESTTQCKALADAAARTAVAKADFAKIAKHIFVGDGTSNKLKIKGRHTSSSWEQANGDAGKTVDPSTHLAEYTVGPANKPKPYPKTVFIDNGPGPVHYNQASITRICEDVIVASLTHAKITAGPAPTGTYSVKSFQGGPNICVKYAGNSCYPASIKATTHALGSSC